MGQGEFREAEWYGVNVQDVELNSLGPVLSFSKLCDLRPMT